MAHVQESTLSVIEAAERVGKSERTIRRWAEKAPALVAPGSGPMRIFTSALDAYLANGGRPIKDTVDVEKVASMLSIEQDTARKLLRDRGCHVHTRRPPGDTTHYYVEIEDFNVLLGDLLKLPHVLVKSMVQVNGPNIRLHGDETTVKSFHLIERMSPFIPQSEESDMAFDAVRVKEMLAELILTLQIDPQELRGVVDELYAIAIEGIQHLESVQRSRTLDGAVIEGR